MKLEKKIPINFSSPRMRRTNTCYFTSGWIQNRARRETGNSGPVTSIQERCFRRFQCFCCAKEENMVLRCVVYGCSKKKDEEKRIYIHQIPFYDDTRSEAVQRRRKSISFLNGSRKHWTPKQCMNFFFSINSEKYVVTPRPRLFSFWISITLVISLSQVVINHAKLFDVLRTIRDSQNVCTVQLTRVDCLSVCLSINDLYRS